MYSGTIEIRRMTPGLRAWSVVFPFALVAIFAWRIELRGGQDLWMVYIAGLLGLWAAAWALRVPALVARADDSGLAYTDMHLAVLLVFSEERAAWSDVIEVNTHRIKTRYSSFLRTNVKVRAPGGDGTRSIAVASLDGGYAAFLAALREGTAGGVVVVKGLGFIEDGVAAATRGTGRGRRVLVIVLMVLAGLWFILQLVRRR